MCKIDETLMHFFPIKDIEVVKVFKFLPIFANLKLKLNNMETLEKLKLAFPTRIVQVE